MTLKTLFAALVAGAILAPAARAEPATQDSGQNPVVRAVFDQPTNITGKSLQTVTVSYPPGARSAAHHHAKSAFIMAYVISGAIRANSKVSRRVSITPARRGVKPPARTT